MEQIRTEESKNFIEELVEQDMKDNPVVRTRFPPEPNGYIHIGHAKALFVDLALQEGMAANATSGLTIQIPQRRT